VVTTNGLVVEPLDHVYVPPVKPAVAAVKLTEPPLQNVNGPLAATVGCGGIGFTVTVTEPETGAVQLDVDWYVTVYVPEVVTTNGLLVELFDQVYVPPVKPAVAAVKLTEPPSQNVNGPLAVTVGCGGIGFTVTVVDAETGAVQLDVDL